MIVALFVRYERLVNDATRSTGAAPTSSVDPDPLAALWLGDSYPAGTGAGSLDAAESCVTSKRMGWVCLVAAQGSTGYVADGHELADSNQALPDRLPGVVARYAPDVVLIDTGRNDDEVPVRRTEAAASQVFDAVRAAWPDAALVVIAPYFIGSDVPPLGAGFVDFLDEEMARVGGIVLDPLGEGWIGDRSAGYVGPDGLHPTPAGHAYIAAHLAGDLRAAGVG